MLRRVARPVKHMPDHIDAAVQHLKKWHRQPLCKALAAPAPAIDGDAPAAEEDSSRFRFKDLQPFGSGICLER
jgi:hypothetical protein